MTVVADPDSCHFQFDPVGKKKFVQSCDIAKAALAKAGVPYETSARRWAASPWCASGPSRWRRSRAASCEPGNSRRPTGEFSKELGG